MTHDILVLIGLFALIIAVIYAMLSIIRAMISNSVKMRTPYPRFYTRR